ncbi:Uncharacterized protein Rs2_34713 [Raphanus sativus]|nr:Uncharacterized protein Rs2_34713 [Raphanus sativus]
MGDFYPFTAKKQEREEVKFKDESAFFTRFGTCLLLGESAHGNNMYGSSLHDSSAKVILKDDSMFRGSHIPAVDLGDNMSLMLGKKQQVQTLYQKVLKQSMLLLTMMGQTQPWMQKKTFSFSSYVLSETCSLVPDYDHISFNSSLNAEESSPFKGIHDQINGALEELAIE